MRIQDKDFVHVKPASDEEAEAAVLREILLDFAAMVFALVIFVVSFSWVAGW
jgi:hypothetical protein